mmetsp:Transcript_34701/g.40907  ORF Transcript_34701/g.40907 Transcript_34701/m.40907 type:complete len:1195 (+) Transcript_34701:115-3699(+)
MALSSGSTLTCKICGANMNHDRSIYKHNDTYHRASLKMSQFGELDENDDLFYCVLCDFYVERKFEKAHHLCRYHNEMRKQRSITDEDMKIHQDFDDEDDFDDGDGDDDDEEENHNKAEKEESEEDSPNHVNANSNKHPLYRKFFVAALSDDNSVDKLAERSADWMKYSRYRVMDVEEKHNTTFIKLHNYDTNECTEDGELKLFEIEITLLRAYGSQLGKLDVLRNRGDLSICDKCKQRITDGYVRSCDGCFPYMVGLYYPDGAYGRQFGCRRGGLCRKCSNSHDAYEKSEKKRFANKKTTPKIRSDLKKLAYWFCSKCVVGPRSTEDVYGSSFFVPAPGRILPDDVLPLSTPVTTWRKDRWTTVKHPDYWLEMIKKEMAKEYAMQRGKSADEVKLCHSNAKEMNDVFTKHHLPNEAKDDILKVINRQHAYTTLPNCVETLHNRASQSTFTEKQLPVLKVRFDVQDNSQIAKTITLIHTQILFAIQMILDDERIDPSSFVFTPIDNPTKYTTVDGKRVFGPEQFQASKFKKHFANVPQKNRHAWGLLANIWTDKTFGKGVVMHPVEVSIANQLLWYRMKLFSSIIVAFSPIISRRPDERQSESEKHAKQTLIASFLAHILSHLNDTANELVYFRVRSRDENGCIVTSRKPMVVRIGLINGDIEEKLDLTATSHTGCYKCFDVNSASYHGKDHAFATPCGQTYPRHFPAVYKAQLDTLNAYRFQFKSTGDEIRRQTGIRPFVETSMNRLDNILLPEGISGHVATDILHVVGHGIAKKLTEMLDKLFGLHFKVIEGLLVNVDDMRALVDMYLSLIPNHSDYAEFNDGYWNREGKGISASNMEDLLFLLLFSYVGSDILIKDKKIRIRMINMHYNLIKLIVTCKTSQWITNNEVDAANKLTTDITKDLIWFTETLEKTDNSVGNGMLIPKLHELIRIASDMKDFGNLMNASTSSGESHNKFTKEAAEKIRIVGNIEKNQVSLFKKICSSQFNDALGSHAQSDNQKTHRHLKMVMWGKPLYHGSSEFFDLFYDLKHSKQILRLEEDFITNISDDTDYSIFNTLQIPLLESDSSLRLSSGQCVKLVDNTYVQVLFFINSAIASDTFLPNTTPHIKVVKFVPTYPSKPQSHHPDLPLTCLRREVPLNAHVIDATLFKERVHLVPLLNSADPSNVFPEHFIVNTLKDPYYLSKLLFLFFTFL